MRRALSEVLKSLPDAPHDIVFTLALDNEATVAAPVLEFSPVLTDDDLKEVIRASPMTAQLSAISRRINVGEEVSNAIVGTGNVDAITALLKNTSAQIREETLDAIIDVRRRGRCRGMNLWSTAANWAPSRGPAHRRIRRPFPDPQTLAQRLRSRSPHHRRPRQTGERKAAPR